MAKKLSSVILEIDVDNPNKIANYSAGGLVREIGLDLKNHCGKAVQGFAVATAASDKVIAAAKKDLIAGKLKHPIVRAGICGGELIFQVTDKDNSKYEQVGVLSKNYVKLRDEIRDEKTLVGNLEPDDDIARQSADRMANAKGSKAVHGEKKMPFGKITGSKSLMLIAHGSVKTDDLGDTLYGKNFGGKSAADLVRLLTENKDDTKRLSPEYAGILYLNGCFTATPDKMGRYAEDVWKLLKAKGYTKLKVKGNLGEAEVQQSGRMLVTTPQAEAEADRLKARFEKDLGVKFDNFQKLYDQKEKSLKEAQAKLDKLTVARTGIWNATFKKTNDTKGFQAAPLVQKIDAEITGTLQPTIKRLTTELADWEKAARKLVADVKKVPGYKVEDFVGQYGLQMYR